MKKNIVYLFVLLCAVSLISSCSEDEDVLPVDNTTIGNIMSDRVVVGVNQKVLFACPISISEEATDVQIQWEYSDGVVSEADSYENGISYKTYTWTKPSYHVIKLKVHYKYGSSEIKTFEQAYNLTVVKTYFRNSLWGDDLQTVLMDNPNIKFDHGEYIDRESESEYHLFQFYYQGRRFSGGGTFKTIAKPEKPDPMLGINLFTTEIEKYKGKLKVIYQVYTTSGAELSPEMEEIISDFKDGYVSDANKLILGKLVDDKIVTLLAIINNQGHHTCIEFYVNQSTNDYELETSIDFMM